MTRFSALVVALVLSASTLAACAEPPTVETLGEAILRAANDDPAISLSEEEAACIAGRLVNSGLSDTTLEGLAADFDQPTVLVAEQSQVEPLVAEAHLDCAG